MLEKLYKTDTQERQRQVYQKCRSLLELSKLGGREVESRLQEDLLLLDLRVDLFIVRKLEVPQDELDHQLVGQPHHSLRTGGRVHP